MFSRLLVFPQSYQFEDPIGSTLSKHLRSTEVTATARNPATTIKTIGNNQKPCVRVHTFTEMCNNEVGPKPANHHASDRNLEWSGRVSDDGM